MEKTSDDGRKYSSTLHNLGDDAHAQSLGGGGFVVFQADEEGRVHTTHLTAEAMGRLCEQYHIDRGE